MKSDKPIDEMRIDTYNSLEGNLKYIDCPICKNKGMIAKLNDDGYEYRIECECMKKRRAIQQIEQSGLSRQIKTLTFDNYHAEYEWQREHKKTSIDFLSSDRWFYYGGQSGCGKTHLCTAICGKLLMRGIPVKYIRWREESAKIKANANDDVAYNQLLNVLKKATVLYIDDFFKGKVTDADIKLAFDLIDYRYINHSQTIISSEIQLSKLSEIDEAIQGRIAERSKGFVLKTEKNSSNNYRLKV